MEAVLVVPIAIGIGWGCDRMFDSSPIGMGIGVVLGFAAMLLRILRMRPSEADLEENAAIPPAPPDPSEDSEDPSEDPIP